MTEPLIDIVVPHSTFDVMARLHAAAAASAPRFGQRFELTEQGERFELITPPISHEAPQAMAVGCVESTSNGSRVRLYSSGLSRGARRLQRTLIGVPLAIGLALAVRTVFTRDYTAALVVAAAVAAIIGVIHLVSFASSSTADDEAAVFLRRALSDMTRASP
jgi:hypothetical protein